MGLLAHSFPWARQPQVPAGLNGRSSLARGLIYLNSSSNCVEVVSGKLPSTLPPLVGSVEGIGVSGVPTASTMSFVLPQNVVNEVTIGAVVRTTELSNTGSKSSVVGASGLSGFLQGAFSGGTVISAELYYYPNYNGQVVLSSSWVANTTYVFVLRYRRNVQADWYINGVLAATATPSDLAVQLNPVGAQWQTGDSGSGFSASVLMSAIWDHFLNDQDTASFSSNPWQVFLPMRRAYTVTASGILVPVLSAATVTGITNTTALPRVTVTF